MADHGVSDLIPAPFRVPDELVEGHLAAISAVPRAPHRRAELALKLAARRVASVWTTPQEVRDAVRHDPRNRFKTLEAVTEAMRRYSPLHGGELAEAEIRRLQLLCEGFEPVPIYHKLLRHSGDSPAEIVRFVRESTLHIDNCPAVVKDGN